MARSLSIAAYLASLGSVDEGSDQGAQPPRPTGTIIWARCTHAEQLTAIETLGRKLSEDGDPIQLIATLRDWGHYPSDRALPEPKGKEKIRSFIDHWQPVMVIWMRGDLDLILLDEIRSADVPRILVDADGEGLDNVAGGWVPGALRSVLTGFEAALTLDNAAADRLIRAGAIPETILVTGAMEDSEPALPCDEEEREAFSKTIGTRPVWLAAGAKIEEWFDLCRAHQEASARAHRLLLIVVPSDLDDAPQFVEFMRMDGFQVALRSEEMDPEETVQIYIADTDEEIGLWYRISPICYMGGTLHGGGCRDPFEATALGSVALYGPEIAPYQKHTARLNAAGASRLIRSSDDLGGIVEALLSPDVAAKVAHAAWDVTSRGADVTNRVAAYIRSRLDEMVG
ncbi:glycosyltransferase N-terminal domain-containing protein [Yoonia sp. BS5-3]|uniref:3-deoxy-D-manno-octulosonic acid transferase n=1 Tax=Yoonia phaeophyticola TaxID=3137369 RepID=A0ABZ2V5Y3_9RHOB